MPHVGVEPRGGQASGHEPDLLVGHGVVAMERHDPPDGPAGRECAAQAPQQLRRRIVGGCAVGTCQRDERRVGDAALELAHHAQLPRRRVVEQRHRFGAELQRRRGAPHRRVRGIQVQHATILPERRSA